MEKDGFFMQVKEMAESYVEDRILLLRLHATEKAAKASAFLFIVVTTTLLCFILLMILSFIAGYYLSQLTKSYITGFGILAILYAVAIAVLLVLNKKFIARKVEDKVVKFSLEPKDTFSNEV